MKYLLSRISAALLFAACLIPASAPAYYYHGRYYPYRYHGRYYQYHYRGHYYLHRTWVVPVNGRPGYYRYY